LQKATRIPESLMRAFWFPAGIEYYEGLPRLQGKGTGKGPIVAKGSGHIVQLDRPDIVASELFELLQASANLTHSRI
jgi:hypothetical protein